MSIELATESAESIAQRAWRDHDAGHTFGVDAETGEPLSAYDYLESALDIIYMVSGDGTYRGAEVLMGFGGPNVRIDTRAEVVRVTWYSAPVERRMPADMMRELDDALSELWEMR